MTTPSAPRFWEPDFEIEQRPDGVILMRQRGELPGHLPTLTAYLDHYADTVPERIFLAQRGEDGAWRELSYAQVRDTARCIGSALLEAGLGPDRPLLILSENSLEHALMGLGAMYAGIPYAPLSTAYSLVSSDHAKLKDIAALLQPGMVFAADGDAYGPAMAAIAAPGRVQAVVRGGPEGAVRFADLAAHAPSEAAAKAHAGVGAGTVAKYLFTSGSTGSPKAVINTHGMLTSNQAMVRDCFRFLEDHPPVVLEWAPWNHTAGGNKVFNMVMTNGGTFYIDDGRPVPGKFDETLRNLHDVAPTWAFNVPVGYEMLLRALQEDRELAAKYFSRLDMLMYAGAGIAQHTWDGLTALAQEVTGHGVLLATGLGATETGPFALMCTEPQKVAGNIGVPSRGITLKLVPMEGKLDARLKSPSITPGYFGDEGKTAEALDEEGFYRLGDALRPADPEDLTKGFFFDGRTAENFKLSTGTWVAAGAVRAALVNALGGLARDAVIVGEDKPQLGALLVPDMAELHRLDPAAQADAPMASAPVRAAIEERLAKFAAAATGSSMRVRRVAFLGVEPSLDRGEVTDKGSLNQRALRANHTPRIEALYAGGGDVVTV